MLCLEHLSLRYVEINYILKLQHRQGIVQTAILIPMYYTK